MEPMVASLRAWMVDHGIPIMIILVAALIAQRLLQSAAHKWEARLHPAETLPTEEQKRLKTLSGIIHTTINLFIYAVALMMIITECGIAVGPLLAGAGIVGLAVGFGAQSLVKDIISGFFLIMENQLRIGDVVTVAGIGGLVEAVNLRTTRLRDLEGKVHIIPNGSIGVVTNFTRDWSRALVEIGVAYKEDVDQVISILKDVGEALRSDPEFSAFILEPLTVLGLDSFGDSSVNIRMFFKTVPLKQWDVAREFRKRVKKAFDEQGIEIPFPHRTIYLGEAESTGTLRVESVAGSEKSKA